MSAVGKIDEAHLLSHDALEALRLLTNHRLDTESPFATILLGQPTLAARWPWAPWQRSSNASPCAAP